MGLSSCSADRKHWRELGKRGASVCSGAHVFPASFAARGDPMNTCWPLRCRQIVVWHLQGCLLKGGDPAGCCMGFTSPFPLPIARIPDRTPDPSSQLEDGSYVLGMVKQKDRRGLASLYCCPTSPGRLISGRLSHERTELCGFKPLLFWFSILCSGT